MTEQKAGLLGSAAFVPKGGMYLHNQRLGLVTALDETQLTKEYLYFFLNRSEIKVEVGRTATGSKVRHTSPGKLLDLVIALPVLEEQVLMSRTLGSVDEKLKVHASVLNALKHLFGTLLHQLMTAQVRVHDFDLSELDKYAPENGGGHVYGR
jgi:type I restriction enzyme S subunit